MATTPPSVPTPTAIVTVTPSSAPAPSSGSGNSGASGTTLMLVACIALLGVLATAGIQWWVGRRTSGALKGSADAAKANAEAARISAEAAGKSAKAAQDAVGVNAESAAGIARRAEADARSKLYQEAAGQLGHEKAAVRLAGVYGLARLADDWPDQRQTCIDVLCAYLRIGREYIEMAQGEDETVRDAINRVVIAHLDSRAPISWSDAYFNFEGAVFQDMSWDDCHFGRHVNFKRTVFTGSCSMIRSTMPHGMDMAGAVIKGQLDIAVAELGYSNLMALTIEPDAELRLTVSRLSGEEVSFSDLQTSGHLNVDFALRHVDEIGESGLVVMDRLVAKGGEVNVSGGITTWITLRDWVLEDTESIIRVSAPMGEGEAPPGRNVIWDLG